MGRRAEEDDGRRGILERLSLTWEALRQDTVSPTDAMDLAGDDVLLESAAAAPPKAKRYGPI